MHVHVHFLVHSDVFGINASGISVTVDVHVHFFGAFRGVWKKCIPCRCYDGRPCHCFGAFRGVCKFV